MIIPTEGKFCGRLFFESADGGEGGGAVQSARFPPPLAVLHTFLCSLIKEWHGNGVKGDFDYLVLPNSISKVRVQHSSLTLHNAPLITWNILELHFHICNELRTRNLAVRAGVAQSMHPALFQGSGPDQFNGLPSSRCQ